MTDGEVAARILKMKEFDLRPYYIEQRFSLRTPIYSETAAYGHMGRQPQDVVKVFNKGKKNEIKVKVRLFPWEDTSAAAALKKAFGI
jgi:S-adenosylmethionine synthetase